jgi:hypothetical protein
MDVRVYADATAAGTQNPGSQWKQASTHHLFAKLLGHLV